MSNTRKIVASKPVQIAFHLAFWAFFLALPYLLNQPKDQGPLRAPRTFRTIPEEYITWVNLSLNLVNIFLFYINAYFLIPKVLKQRGGALWYVISAIAAIVVFTLIGAFLRWKTFFPQGEFRLGMWSFYPVVMVFAISTSYRIISDYIEDERRRKELENSRLYAELGFLRSQISPHFMFNVLNSLVALNRKKSDLVEPVIISLSGLLRYMLYESDDSKVSLDKEVKYLRSYIDLQQLRFSKDVKLELDLPSDLPSRNIEPMLLIPFVENAYKHGVGIIIDPYISVHLDASAEHLHFSVENKVNRAFEEPKDPASGIGLANVRRRLSLLYPDSHELRIHETDTTYRVTLTLHFKPELFSAPVPSRPLRAEIPSTAIPVSLGNAPLGGHAIPRSNR